MGLLQQLQVGLVLVVGVLVAIILGLREVLLQLGAEKLGEILRQLTPAASHTQPLQQLLNLRIPLQATQQHLQVLLASHRPPFLLLRAGWLGGLVIIVPRGIVPADVLKGAFLLAGHDVIALRIGLAPGRFKGLILLPQPQLVFGPSLRGPRATLVLVLILHLLLDDLQLEQLLLMLGYVERLDHVVLDDALKLITNSGHVGVLTLSLRVLLALGEPHRLVVHLILGAIQQHGRVAVEVLAAGNGAVLVLELGQQVGQQHLVLVVLIVGHVLQDFLVELLVRLALRLGQLLVTPAVLRHRLLLDAGALLLFEASLIALQILEVLQKLLLHLVALHLLLVLKPANKTIQ